MTERVAAGEQASVDRRPSAALRRGWWVAAAAVVAVVLLAVGFLAGNGSSSEPDEAPLASDSEEPRSDTSGPLEQDQRDPALAQPPDFEELGEGWRELSDSADEWRPIAPPPGADGTRGSALSQGVWTGSEAVFWAEGLAYDPTVDAWHEIAPAPLISVAAGDPGVALVTGAGRTIAFGTGSSP